MNPSVLLILNEIIEDLSKNEIAIDKQNLYDSIKECIKLKDSSLFSLLDDQEASISKIVIFFISNVLKSEWNVVIDSSENSLNFLKNEILKLDNNDDQNFIHAIDKIINYVNGKEEMNPFEILSLISNPELIRYFNLIEKFHNCIENE